MVLMHESIQNSSINLSNQYYNSPTETTYRLKDISKYESSSKNIINNCPHCQSTTIIKYGKYKNEQRFMCKKCKKTFSPRTNTILYYSKKDTAVWKNYLQMMLYMAPLRICAEKLKINLSTAFLWRHKILHTLDPIMEPTELSGSINIRRIFEKENLKGSRKISTTNRRRIWIYTSSDNNDKIITKPICFPLFDMNKYNESIFNKINKSSYIYTNCDRFVIALSKKHNQGNIEFIDPNSKILVNNFANKFRRLVLNCHGIASKYLLHYFPLVKIFASSKIYDLLSLFNNIIRYTLYIRRDDLKKIFSI